MRRALGSLRVEEPVDIHRPDDGAGGLTELVGTLIGINISFEAIIAIILGVLMIMGAFRRR